MQRVLIISPFAKPDVGGVESHLFKLTEYLKVKNKYAISLISFRPLNSKIQYKIYQKLENIEYIKMPWFGVGLFRKFEGYFPLNFIYLFPGLFLVSSVVFLLRYKEIKVIHAHGLVAATIGLVLKKFKKIKLIVSTHAVYGLEPNNFKSYLYKAILRRADKILAVGEPSRDELIAIGLKLESDDIHRNWIDLSFYRPQDQSTCKAKYGIDVNKRVCIFVGRMIEIKGELLLLKAASKFHSDVEFIFVGEGPTKEQIRKASFDSQNIKLLENIPDIEMPTIYGMADVFVSPVLYEEGFATVYLEALACGVPIVTAKRGCLPYFLTDDIGILIEDVVTLDNLIYSINKVLERNNGGAMKEICRKYAETNFNNLNAERIVNEYRQ